MRRPSAASAGAVLLGTVVVPLAAGVALAHPLGNFTINHYAGIRVEPSRVLVDVVIDEAEIPTFQATQAFDLDGDGTLSPAETVAARRSGCESVSGGPVARRRRLGRAAAARPRRGSRSRPATAGCRRCGWSARSMRAARARRSRRGHDDRVPGRLRVGAHRLARDGRHRVRRHGRRARCRRPGRRAGSPPTRAGSPARRTCGRCRSPSSPGGAGPRALRRAGRPTARRAAAVAPVAAATAMRQVPGGDASIPTCCGARRRPRSSADRAAHGRRDPRRGPCPDARPRQDADGGVPRRHARDAATRRRAGPGGERVAHARDPRARRARAGGRDPAAAGPRGPRSRRWSPRCRSSSIGGWMLFTEARRAIAARRAAVTKGSRRPRTRPRRTAPEHAHDADHDHGPEHGHERRARPRPRRVARPRPRARALARRRAPHPPAARGLDDLVAQPVRPRARRRPRARPRARC